MLLFSIGPVRMSMFHNGDEHFDAEQWHAHYAYFMPQRLTSIALADTHELKAQPILKVSNIVRRL
jgi:hypothetical protein